MSQTLILLRKSLLNFSRARAAIVITFLVPIALIYIFGQVFGFNRNDGGGPSGIKLAIINESKEPAAQRLVEALKTEKTFTVVTEAKGTHRPLTETEVRTALHDNDYRFALIIPADFVREDQFGIHLKFLSNPRNEIETQMVNGILQKTIFSKVPQLLGQSLQRRAQGYLGNASYEQFNHSIAGSIAHAFGGDVNEIQKRIESGNYFGAIETPAKAPSNQGAASATSADDSDLLSRVVKIDAEQVAGKSVKNPMAARIVGGYAIMFLLFAVSGGAASMFEEKATGIFQRLLSSPVRPAHILWARFLFGMILGLVQISALFLAGRFFFGLDIFQNAVPLLVMAIAASAACSSFGILIVALSPSAQAAQGLSTLVVLSMSALGGAWFPVPAGIQAISKLTIVYWSVEGMTDVLWAGYSLPAILPKVGILFAIAFVVMIASIWRLNRNRFFEG